jgi:ribonucleotide reductase alpha subunit
LKKIKKFSSDNNFIPHVEMVQDLVEEELMRNDFVKVAKAIYYTDKKERKLERK